MGGLSISVEGLGNDLVLYWTANCLHHEGPTKPFSFMPGFYYICYLTSLNPFKLLKSTVPGHFKGSEKIFKIAVFPSIKIRNFYTP
jgi:hypothetical protein